MKFSFRLLALFSVFCLFILINSADILAENISFSSDDGLTWNRERKIITLHTNAIAKTPNYTLSANSIIANYRDNKKIYKISAIGNVKLISSGFTITTNNLIYDIDKEKFELLSSSDVSTVMVNDKSKIISKGNIVYLKDKYYAVADKIEITNMGRTIFSDSANIKFDNRNKIISIVAIDNVKVIDGTDELCGDIAEYNPKNGYVTISGNVYFNKSGEANISGGSIEYNLNTGIAKILPNKQTGRVSGSFKTKTTSKN